MEEIGLNGSAPTASQFNADYEATRSSIINQLSTLYTKYNEQIGFWEELLRRDPSLETRLNNYLPTLLTTFNGIGTGITTLQSQNLNEKNINAYFTYIAGLNTQLLDSITVYTTLVNEMLAQQQSQISQQSAIFSGYSSTSPQTSSQSNYYSNNSYQQFPSMQVPVPALNQYSQTSSYPQYSGYSQTPQNFQTDVQSNYHTQQSSQSWQGNNTKTLQRIGLFGRRGDEVLEKAKAYVTNVTRPEGLCEQESNGWLLLYGKKPDAESLIAAAKKQNLILTVTPGENYNNSYYTGRHAVFVNTQQLNMLRTHKELEKLLPQAALANNNRPTNS